MFDTVDTLIDTLRVFADMIGGLTVNQEAMRRAASEGFATATDLADYLVKKGVPFREAHEAVARAVRHRGGPGRGTGGDCRLADLQQFSQHIDADAFEVLTLEGSLKARDHFGGTAPRRVQAAIVQARRELGEG